MNLPTSSPSTVRRPPLAVGTIVACPDTACDQFAEVVDAWVWPSTTGPVPHVRTRCIARHIFTLPIDGLAPTVQEAPAGAAPRVATDA